MNSSLLDSEVQNFLRLHQNDDVVSLILKGSPFKNVSGKELAQQIEGRRKIERKLPSWFKTSSIVYPPLLNLSQSSSETTAKYKSNLISGESIIDITGGFGVDAYYFSTSFKKVLHCEKNKELAAIVAHNFKQLPTFHPIATIQKDSIAFLNELERPVDWLYADPGRRTGTGRKVFRLEDSIPNILNHLDLLFRCAKGILLKTSPMLDLSLGKAQLKAVSEIHVIAVKNEVKELLWVLEEDKKEATRIRTVNFDTHENQCFEAFWRQEETEVSTYSPPMRYLYEPNAALLKAGLFNTVASAYAVHKLAQNTHLYTSQELLEFPGRRFEILETFPFQKAAIKKMGIHKANITTRNFPITVRDLRKKYKFQEGGKEYLFFTQTYEGAKIILRCRKVQPAITASK